MKDAYSSHSDNQIVAIFDLDACDDGFGFGQSISRAMKDAEAELESVEKRLEESATTLNSLTPQCDKIDYALSVASGALCGVLDVFLVGKPGESPVGEVTDQWFGERVKGFARLCGWDGQDDRLPSAILYLGRKFRVPYDQRGAGDAASEIFDLKPSNHHFKSLAHNPSLLGLFFSVLDQFDNSSHFVSEGQLISIEDVDGGFELRGRDVPSKLFCAFANWLGHLLSDVSGSESSKGRGMGIPSPIWSWTNDVVALKQKLRIPVSDFNVSMNELALKIYEKGFDARFQTAQAIPVLINELLVRLMYSIRRAIKYLSEIGRENRSPEGMWRACEPFSNATVKRMLTVAHGSFCLVDMGDAAIRGLAEGGGAFNVVEFAMRLNVVGIGRLTISLYGEATRGLGRAEAQEEVYFLRRRRLIVDDYIEALNTLADLYDDRQLLTFVDDLKGSSAYKAAFQKSVRLAEKRKVPEERILRTKDDIDAYFLGEDHG